jgi:hypothetical protein
MSRHCASPTWASRIRGMGPCGSSNIAGGVPSSARDGRARPVPDSRLTAAQRIYGGGTGVRRPGRAILTAYNGEAHTVSDLFMRITGQHSWLQVDCDPTVRWGRVRTGRTCEGRVGDQREMRMNFPESPGCIGRAVLTAAHSVGRVFGLASRSKLPHGAGLLDTPAPCSGGSGLMCAGLVTRGATCRSRSTGFKTRQRPASRGRGGSGFGFRCREG